MDIGDKTRWRDSRFILKSLFLWLRWWKFESTALFLGFGLPSTLLLYVLLRIALFPKIINHYKKSLFTKQEFKEDMKDETSLSDYLKKPSQRLSEYILHLQVRESKQFSFDDLAWSGFSLSLSRPLYSFQKKFFFSCVIIFVYSFLEYS